MDCSCSLGTLPACSFECLFTGGIISCMLGTYIRTFEAVVHTVLLDKC